MSERTEETASVSTRDAGGGRGSGNRGGWRGRIGPHRWTNKTKRGSPSQNSFAPLNATDASTRSPLPSHSRENTSSDASASPAPDGEVQNVPHSANDGWRRSSTQRSGSGSSGPQGGWRLAGGSLGYLPPPPGILDRPSYAHGWLQVGSPRGRGIGAGGRDGDRGVGSDRGRGRGRGIPVNDHSTTDDTRVIAQISQQDLGGMRGERGQGDGARGGRGDNHSGYFSRGRGIIHGRSRGGVSQRHLGQGGCSSQAATPDRGGWNARGRDEHTHGRASGWRDRFPRSPLSTDPPQSAMTPPASEFFVSEPGSHRAPVDYGGRGHGFYGAERGRRWGSFGDWNDRVSTRGRGERGRGFKFARGGFGTDSAYGGQREYRPHSDVNFGRGRPPAEELPPPRDMMQGLLVPALQQLTAPEVALPDKPISIKNLKCIGSYTWLDNQSPTIIVPGAVREWHDRVLPLNVYFDRGIRMLNENAYRMGSASALTPLFRAVDAFHSSHCADSTTAADEDEDVSEPVNWPTVDFVTDRNNLRKLMRWLRDPGPERPSQTSSASPTSGDIKDEANADCEDAATPLTEPEWDPRHDFRIDLRLCGEKTVLMDRWAVFDREHVVPPKGGCRDNFLREAMAGPPGCTSSGGHYRIVQYDLDGLKMVVRWEVDACAGDLAEAPLSASSTSEPEPATPPTVLDPTDYARSPAVDIDVLARWDDTTNGTDATAWGVPVESASNWDDQSAPPPITTPQVSAKSETTNDIDKLARWEDDIPEANAWDVPASSGTSASPIGQSIPQSVSMDWDTPTESSTSAWATGHSTVTKNASNNLDVTTGWDGPATSDASEWGIGDPVDDGPSPGSSLPDLKIIRGGTLLPQSSLLELATRSIQYLDNTKIEDTFVQLFLTQSPTNLLAVHSRGMFDRVVRQDLDSPDLHKVYEDPEMQKSLCAFIALLREIQELAKKHERTGRLSLVCQKGKLEVYSRVGEEDVLLASELSRFDAK